MKAKEDDGIRRLFFAPSNNSKGTRILKSAEVPSPWKVFVCPKKMYDAVKKFLDNYPEATMSGDPRGHRYYE